MSSGLVELIPLTEVEDHLFGILQAILKVDEMEHKVANRIEYDVLGKHFGDSHCLSLGLLVTTG